MLLGLRVLLRQDRAGVVVVVVLMAVGVVWVVVVLCFVGVLRRMCARVFLLVPQGFLGVALSHFVTLLEDKPD